MRICEVSANPDDDVRRTAIRFVDHVEASTSSPALSDHLRIAVSRQRAPHPSGPLLVTISESAELVALAVVADAHDTALLEVVVDAQVDHATAVRDDAAATAVDAHRRRSTAPVVWWLDDPTEHDRTVAAGLGLAPTRELYEMRRALPHPRRASVATRAFRPGLDDEAWLRVNNRAFASHGEQGGWTADTLHLRFGEPWFDAEGFRLHEIDGALAAFCWTKLHTTTDPVVGEIYVIGVDPAFQGRGLGTELTLAGLDAISDRGLTIANLYVDAENTAAVSLYDRLGFRIHRRRAAFAPQEAPT